MTGSQLTRSVTDRKLAGVCGGLAEWLDLDPTLVRIAYVVLSVLCAAFPGLLLYIILAFVIPGG